ncbi:MAG: diadenylate cyclase [Kiritimatiellae bacterium]|nr:diadenylate cyclase [Kiritimatiellia bacterium]
MIDASAIIQIAILYVTIYAILKGAKGSRFGQALMGFGILAALLIAFSYLFHFDVLTRIVQFLLVYIAVSTVVIFQPEIRRILSAVGAFGYLEKPKYRPGLVATPELVVETLVALADRRLGALVAFERGISLRGYEDTGVPLDAVFSRELVTSIFTPPLPLHDGGVVLRDGRISSAHCIFPVSNNPELVASGMRHRAAVGLSEETDALVVVVSEESGSISVARNGKMFKYAGDQRAEPLRRWIAHALPADESDRSVLAAAWTRFRNWTRVFSKGDGK